MITGETEGDDPFKPPAKVVMVVYGDKGKTEELPLMSDIDNPYQAGDTDDFEVSMVVAVIY